MTARRRFSMLAPAFALAVAVATPALARVEVTLDAATLTAFLGTVTPPKVIVSLPSGGEIAIELHDVKVLGFDPAAGKSGKGQLLMALRLAIPALGLEFPVEPRLGLDVEESEGEKLCVLRFEKLPIPLPMTGSIDLSPLLPVIRVPAESAFLVPLKQGDVHVKSRLVDTRMGAEAVRLGFDLEIAPDGAAARKGK
jgi:hypothetical protein